MSKITLNSIGSLTNENSAIVALNDNSDTITNAIDNTLSRDGTLPNEMEADLDMNSNDILNLPEAIFDSSPVTLGQLNDIVSGVTVGNASSVASYRFGSKADAQAASIPNTASVSIGYPQGDMVFKYTSGTPSHAGYFTSANGYHFVTTGECIAPQFFGAAFDGATDDIVAHRAINTCLNALGTGYVKFPRNLSSMVWPASAGAIPSQDRIYDIVAVNNVTFDFNGSKIISTATSFADNSYLFVVGQDSPTYTLCRDIKFIAPNFEQQGFDTVTNWQSVNPNLSGVGLISLVDNVEDVTIENLRQMGGRSGIVTLRHSEANRCRNVTINGAHFEKVFYPINFRKNGDNLHAVNIYSKNHGRFYYVYNVCQHFVRATVEEYGNIVPPFDIFNSADPTETAISNTTSDIDVAFDQVYLGTPSNVAPGYVGVGFQQLTTTTSAATIRNIKVKFGITQPIITGLGFGVEFYKHKSDLSNDAVARGYLMENIEISGMVDYRNQASGVFMSLFNVDAASNQTGTDWTGEAIRNIVIRDLSIQNNATVGDDDIRIDMAHVSSLSLDNVYCTRNIEIRNSGLGKFGYRNVTCSATFSINAVTQVTISDNFSDMLSRAGGYSSIFAGSGNSFVVGDTGDSYFNCTSLQVRNPDTTVYSTISAGAIAMNATPGANTIGSGRVTTSNTAGTNLTLNSGGATSGATDKNGGDLLLLSGIATGNGGSNVIIKAVTTGQGAGTADRTATTVATFKTGVQIGSPTGGDKGVGTINAAGDIYKNNTAYTSPDYVFEKYYLGQPKDSSIQYEGLQTLEELSAYTKENLRLPGIDDNPSGLFARSDLLLEKLEEAYLYILELNDRISKLEQKDK